VNQFGQTVNTLSVIVLYEITSVKSRDRLKLLKQTKFIKTKIQCSCEYSVFLRSSTEDEQTGGSGGIRHHGGTGTPRAADLTQ